MQILPTLLAAAVATSQNPVSTTSLTRSDSVLVTAVLDGETITVARLGRVRLLGIDAPKIGRDVTTATPLAREARDRLASLVLRRWVHLEHEGAAPDGDKRHLAYVVRDDGMFVNATLVREGLARVSARVRLLRLDELKRAETDAQRSRLGIWSSTPAAPTRYTRTARATRSRAPRERRSKRVSGTSQHESRSGAHEP